MVATMSSPPLPSPPNAGQSPPSNNNLPALPPLVTTPAMRRTSSQQRPSSYARNRMSSYSTTSHTSKDRSRPVSHVFPIFHSSLTYTLVRDFAYPPFHPYHYGPPPHNSGLSTPASDTRRSSDPAPAAWDSRWDDSRGQWSASPWSSDPAYGNQQLPAMTFGDGPPYSEDEDLHSPVVTSSRHKKHKSSGHLRGRSPGAAGETRGQYIGTNGDGSETYYVNQDDEETNGPGGELVTYPPEEARHSLLHPHAYDTAGRRRDSHFATSIPGRATQKPACPPDSEEELSDAEYGGDESRFSRDYQFTIASPDEEMHGKAVALFDFEREHENELPLTEGQVILVSYRHGQGWLVAEDPKTGESGLVPEEFVRLLRHIEGGLTGLNGEVNANEGGLLSPTSATADTAATPTQADHSRASPTGQGGHSASSSNGGNTEKHPPVVSTFSTSSKDLSPYPPHLLGAQGKATPPQVVHYEVDRSGNSEQMATPTLANPPAEAKKSEKLARRDSRKT